MYMNCIKCTIFNACLLVFLVTRLNTILFLLNNGFLFVNTIVLKCAKYYFPLLFCDCHSYMETIEPYVVVPFTSDSIKRQL